MNTLERTAYLAAAQERLDDALCEAMKIPAGSQRLAVMQAAQEKFARDMGRAGRITPTLRGRGLPANGADQGKLCMSCRAVVVLGDPIFRWSGGRVEHHRCAFGAKDGRRMEIGSMRSGEEPERKETHGN